VLNEHDMGTAPSTYYAHAARGFTPTGAELAEAYLVNEPFNLWTRNRSVANSCQGRALRAGYDLGQDQVERLMKIVGIAGIHRGKRMRTTVRATGEAPRHSDYIQRRWDLPRRPDRWWIADLTYVWTPAGFCYVSFVRRPVLPKDPGLASVDLDEDRAGDLGAEPGVVHPPARRCHLHRQGLVHHSDYAEVFVKPRKL